MKTRRLIVLTILALCLPMGSFADDGVISGSPGIDGRFVFTSEGAVFSGTFSHPLFRSPAQASIGSLSSGRVTIQPAATIGDSTSLASADPRSETLPVAEPGTLVLVGTGLLGLAGSMRGRKKA